MIEHIIRFHMYLGNGDRVHHFNVQNIAFKWFARILRALPMRYYIQPLLEITINIGPVDQDYYSFDANGNILQHLNDIYHGDYPLDHKIFEFFPSGNKYITSSSGSIYNKNMVFQGTLPRGSLEFTSFSFDGAQQQIYCGTKSKTIEVYSELNYTHIRSISTKTYPYRLFKDGNNGLVCLSTSTKLDYYSAAPKEIIVEKIQ